MQLPIAAAAGLVAVSAASATFGGEATFSQGATTTTEPVVVLELPMATTVFPTTTAAAPATTAVAPTTTSRPAVAPPTTVRATGTTSPAVRLTPTPTTALRATTVPATPSTGGCHPSYVGPCLPVDAVDVDCAGGSGNGPVYTSAKRFRVVGPDDYGLDGDDNDGLACER